MKVLLGILLVANLIFFAVMRGDLLGDSSAELTQPALNEGKIHLLNAPPVVSSKAVTSAVPEINKNAENAAPLCMEWSDFSGADLKRASDALAIFSLGEKLSQHIVEYSIGYWVYIPPLKDKAATNQKIAQLKARGVEEYFIVQEDGEFQHAISLGIFKTKDAAQKYLDSLNAKDVRSAKVGERASKLKATVFVFNQIDARVADKLNVLQKDFPASELKKTDCR